MPMITTQTTITQTASATRKGLHSGIPPKNWDCLSPLWVALLPFFLFLDFAVAHSAMISETKLPVTTAKHILNNSGLSTSFPPFLIYFFLCDAVIPVLNRPSKRRRALMSSCPLLHLEFPAKCCRTRDSRLESEIVLLCVGM